MRTGPVSSFVGSHLSTNKRLVTRFLFLAIILDPLIFIWQGGDLTDSGFHALRAQNFFADIHSAMMPSDGILSYFIGGMWWQLFPGLGLFGFHLLGALLVIAGSFAPFYALRELREHPVVSLFAILAAQAFLIRINLSFGYDFVSFFFQYWAVAFLLRGLEGQKGSLLFLAGSFIAAAALARVPSILSLGLIVLPLVWKDKVLPFLPDNNKRFSVPFVAIKRMALFMAGFLSACLLAIAIGLATGVADAYFDGLVNLFASSQQGGSHNKGVLFSKYYTDAVLTLQWLGVVLLWVLAAWGVFHRRAPRWGGLVFAAATAVALFIWLADPAAPGYFHPLKYLVLAIYGTWSVLIAIGVLKTSPALRTMAVAGLILTCIGFLGSNTGLLKTKNGMLFLVPACTISAWYGSMERFADMTRKWKRIALVLAGLLFVSSFAARFGYVYHVSSRFLDRLSFTHAYSTPMMFGIRSSKERVVFVDGIVPRINETEPQSEILVFGRTPALYFLTERRPFIKEVWLGENKYSANTIRQSIDQRLSQGADLPLIVITDPGVLGPEGTVMIGDFLNEYRYIKVTESPESSTLPWEIWSPK
jgi:hypothetical protein